MHCLREFGFGAQGARMKTRNVYFLGTTIAAMTLLAAAEAQPAVFADVQAPVKDLVVIDGAGHFPHLTHTVEFLSAMRSRAVPML